MIPLLPPPFFSFLNTFKYTLWLKGKLYICGYSEADPPGETGQVSAKNGQVQETIAESLVCIKAITQSLPFSRLFVLYVRNR